MQTLSSLSLQEDEWWDLKTIGIGLGFFLTEIGCETPINPGSYKFIFVQSAFRQTPGI